MPHTTYRVAFQVDLASNAPTGTVGVGGSPGDSVYVKVGVSLAEPNAIVGDDNYWYMNIDKGNQASSGEDAITIGTIGVELPGVGGGPIYKMKSLDNLAEPLLITTDDQGHVWLLVGVDSGFEALTRIYLTDIAVEFIPIVQLSGTSHYVFLPELSTLVQTGGIAGVNWTYSVEGQFYLTVDSNDRTAIFSDVNATATDNGPPLRELDLNDVFSLDSLVGFIADDGTIEFYGKDVNGSDIVLSLTFSDDLVHFVGETIPPDESADFFTFNLDAFAQKDNDSTEEIQ